MVRVDIRPPMNKLLVLLDKNTGVKDTGLLSPTELGKTSSIGTIVDIGNGTPNPASQDDDGIWYEFTIGDKVSVPVQNQVNTYEFEGNTFCIIHYSYVNFFKTEVREIHICE
jgi:co-chaperonin GroES (HSP10)